jgi:hypothetical protein
LNVGLCRAEKPDRSINKHSRRHNSTLKNTLICERSPENRWFQIYPVEIMGVFESIGDKYSVFQGLFFQPIELACLYNKCSILRQCAEKPVFKAPHVIFYSLFHSLCTFFVDCRLMQWSSPICLILQIRPIRRIRPIFWFV